MTNGKILELAQGLPLCADLKGIKVAFAIAKNSRLISKEIEGLTEVIKKLQEEHSEKDDKGESIIKDNNYQMIDKEKFNSDYKALMDIENGIILHKIKEEDLPADISARQLAILFDFIQENETK